jgi:hypothetical protein
VIFFCTVPVNFGPSDILSLTVQYWFILSKLNVATSFHSNGTWFEFQSGDWLSYVGCTWSLLVYPCKYQVKIRSDYCCLVPHITDL